MAARFIIAIAALLALGTPAEPLDRIRVAVSNPNMPNLTVAMAQEKGFFKDENLKAEIIRMNPNVAITALAAGDIDYCQLFGAVVGWGKVERDSAYASYDALRNLFNADGGVPEDGLKLVIDQARRSAKATREVTAGEVAELTFLREAQAELGIKAR